MKTRELAQAYIKRQRAAKLGKILEAITLRVIMLELGLIALLWVTR